MTGPQESDVDFAHTDQAATKRREKATVLAKFAWDRAISSAELLALPEATLRKFARAAGAHPPSSMETWTTAGELIDRKDSWAQQRTGPEVERAHADEKIMWVKPPITPFGTPR